MFWWNSGYHLTGPLNTLAPPTSARQYPVLVRQIHNQLRMERPEKASHRETYLVLGG